MWLQLRLFEAKLAAQPEGYQELARERNLGISVFDLLTADAPEAVEAKRIAADPDAEWPAWDFGG